ncbi:MAG: LPS export ABC transporter periplasmic protein LptC [Deltaproteobacteria bacterium]|nr:LPS export ABC transporter periplasmic protein LptC [Deltaproteobacteria bacterium]
MKASAIFRLRWAVVWGLMPSRVQHEAPTRPKMETLALTEVEDGNKRWILEAKDAEYLKEQKTIRITGIKVEFFGEGGRVLKVSCQEGLINTKSRALTLRGRVRLEEGDLIIKTETVHYQPKERLLVAPEEVVLESPRLTIRGQGLRVELRSRRLALIRHQSTEVKLTGKGWLK